ncbi:MAG TPA: TRC40/GET3/ArsA family transport-energizing ATPase [Terriglobia bacterium]|nr:TRC40/GET3/ArsA family transport-energizing ATPase [Terriglobia bacterium]
MRIILYSGKGGVGKTSISAATGLELARRGYRTLVMSVDPAHSLSDCFDLEKSLMDHEAGRAVSVAKNLWIQEVDVQEEIGRHWDAVYGYVAALLNVSGLEQTLAEELAIFPGMEEVSSLLYVNQYVREKTFDVVLLDCAPTGESLRFVSIPTTLEWYMSKIFKVERGVAKLVRPMLSTFSSVPLPEDSYFENLQALHHKLEGIDRLLVDPKVTTVRLVTNPEKMVLKETQRAFTFFCLYGLTVDAVIVNRILPPDIHDTFFTAWRETQERWTQAIEEFFSPVEVWRVPLFQDEVLGSDRLRTLADTLFAGRDPAECFYHESPYRFRKVDGNYQLHLRLPFVTAKDVNLHKNLDELIIRVGSIKRHVSLPQRMVQLEPLSARVKDGELIVVLGRSHAQSKAIAEKRRPA